MQNLDNKNNIIKIVLGFMALSLLLSGPIGWLILAFLYYQYRKYGSNVKFINMGENMPSNQQPSDKTILPSQPKSVETAPINLAKQFSGGNGIRVVIFILGLAALILA